MIEVVVLGSTIRHGAKLVGPGSKIVVMEDVAAALVGIGRARYHIEEPKAEAATPAPTEAEALNEPASSDEPATSEATAEPVDAPAEVTTPEEKPKKRNKR